MRKPIIGVTLDAKETGGYSNSPWYALRKNYCEVVAKRGAIPLPLPFHPEFIKTYASMIDGLIVSGGGFDISPSLYNETYVHPKTTLNIPRTEFEYALLDECFSFKKPIFGICGGMQLINVYFKGTLLQDIDSLLEEKCEHKSIHNNKPTLHSISIKPSSFLHQIVGQTSITVNTGHHQAVSNVPDDLVVNAIASDGIIEGIEYKERNQFCLGVQWHPEYELCESDKKIFDAFVRAC